MSDEFATTIGWEIDSTSSEHESRANGHAEPKHKVNGHASGADRPKITLYEFPDRNASQVPPRPWAYGHFLMFGSAAALAAPDKTGKGFITAAMTICLVTGRDLLGEKVWRTGPGIIVTYEDDADEWERRLRAACLFFNIDARTVLPHIRIIQRRGNEKVSFARSEGGRVIFPYREALIEAINAFGCTWVVIDPFNHTHQTGDGNNNTLIAEVGGEIIKIAAETGAAFLVLHHLRKGSSGAADDFMGAVSLRATFRSTRILMKMTAAEAENLGIPPGEVYRHIRISAVALNLAPPPDKAIWWRLENIPLGNGVGIYEAGDDLAVATRWYPAPMFEGMTADTLRRVFEALRQPHSMAAQAKNWVGHPIMQIAARNRSQATKIARAWQESGVLIEGEEVSETRKTTVRVVRLVDAKAHAILATLEGVLAPAGEGDGDAD